MGNPKDSPWRSIPRSARKRIATEVTLSIEARTKLERLEESTGKNRSRMVEQLIMDADIVLSAAARERLALIQSVRGGTRAAIIEQLVMSIDVPGLGTD